MGCDCGEGGEGVWTEIKLEACLLLIFYNKKGIVKRLEESFKGENGQRPTLVEMRGGYKDDQKICLTSVSFIPPSVSGELMNKIIVPLQNIESEHYYYSPESLHLTIKNIRTVNFPPLFTETDIEKVKEVFNTLVPEFTTLEFFIEDIVFFPTSVVVMAYATEEFQRLVLSLDNGLKEAGVPDNKKYFSDKVFWGNITLCRFTKNPGEKFLATAHQMREMKIGRLQVNTIDLITGNAVCHPDSRKVIAEFNLKD